MAGVHAFAQHMATRKRARPNVEEPAWPVTAVPVPVPVPVPVHPGQTLLNVCEHMHLILDMESRFRALDDAIARAKDGEDGKDDGAYRKALSRQLVRAVSTSDVFGYMGLVCRGVEVDDADLVKCALNGSELATVLVPSMHMAAVALQPCETNPRLTRLAAAMLQGRDKLVQALFEPACLMKAPRATLRVFLSSPRYLSWGVYVYARACVAGGCGCAYTLDTVLRHLFNEIGKLLPQKSVEPARRRIAFGLGMGIAQDDVVAGLPHTCSHFEQHMAKKAVYVVLVEQADRNVLEAFFQGVRWGTEDKAVPPCVLGDLVYRSIRAAESPAGMQTLSLLFDCFGADVHYRRDCISCVWGLGPPPLEDALRTQNASAVDFLLCVGANPSEKSFSAFPVRKAVVVPASVATAFREWSSLRAAWVEAVARGGKRGFCSPRESRAFRHTPLKVSLTQGPFLWPICCNTSTTYDDSDDEYWACSGVAGLAQEDLRESLSFYVIDKLLRRKRGVLCAEELVKWWDRIEFVDRLAVYDTYVRDPTWPNLAHEILPAVRNGICGLQGGLEYAAALLARGVRPSCAKGSIPGFVRCVLALT